MPYHTPSYSYTTTDQRRTFHHRWIASNGQVHECESCQSTCDASACYSQHWSKANQHEQLVITAQQQHQLKVITTADVSVFMLCARNTEKATQAFIIDAGINAVPQLLRLLFTQARQLDVSIAFYVKVQQQELLFASSKLSVQHHYDIAESVDVIFTMLLERIENFVCTQQRHGAQASPEYEVKRIRLNVKRIGNASDGAMSLPLQYRVKKACADLEDEEIELLEMWMRSPITAMQRSDASVDLSKITTEEDDTRVMHIYCEKYARMLRVNILAAVSAAHLERDVAVIAEAYLQHKRAGFGAPPLKLNVNLYAFQVCRNSHELFATPHHLISATPDYKSTPSFIVMTDVEGKFCRLKAITNVRRFLRVDAGGRILTCEQCDANFMQRSKLALHKMLHCGQKFNVQHMSPDCVEIYERCLPLDMVGVSDKWTMYGIIE